LQRFSIVDLTAKCPCSTIRSSLNPSSHSSLEESLEIQSFETKYLDADRDADVAAIPPSKLTLLELIPMAEDLGHVLIINN
jgi:hypothetical protein